MNHFVPDTRNKIYIIFTNYSLNQFKLATEFLQRNIIFVPFGNSLNIPQLRACCTKKKATSKLGNTILLNSLIHASVAKNEHKKDQHAVPLVSTNQSNINTHIIITKNMTYHPTDLPITATNIKHIKST